MIPNGRQLSAAGVVPTRRPTTQIVKKKNYILLNRQAYIYHCTLQPGPVRAAGGDCVQEATVDLETSPNQFDGLDFVALVCVYVCVRAVVLFELDTNQTNTVFYGFIQDE